MYELPSSSGVKHIIYHLYTTRWPPWNICSICFCMHFLLIFSHRFQQSDLSFVYALEPVSCSPITTLLTLSQIAHTFVLCPLSSLKARPLFSCYGLFLTSIVIFYKYILLPQSFCYKVWRLHCRVPGISIAPTQYNIYTHKKAVLVNVWPKLYTPV